MPSSRRYELYMHTLNPTSAQLLDILVDRLNIGIFAVDRNMEVTLWNRYMESHSTKPAAEVLGRNLFECFADLPRKMLLHNINSVFILKNFAFTSWEQRPYLFKFRLNRPVTGGADFMYQDCTFIPLKDEHGEVQQVCITLIDVTDTAIYQKMMREAMSSLAEASHRDGLTGIHNRRYIEEAVAKEFGRVQRYGGTLSIILFDLDNYKTINDTHGHLTGDEVLRSAAKSIGAGVRTTATIGRYGGEEIKALLPATNIDGAMILAERQRNHLASLPVIHGGLTVSVTVSSGVAEWQPNMQRYENLIKAADQALYRAKEQGRNCVRSADSELICRPAHASHDHHQLR